MRLDILYVGKARDAHSNALAEEFLKRTSRWASVHMREIVPERYDLFAKHAAGKAWDSAKFIAFTQESEDQARDVVFLLGGHDGLPPAWKPRADVLLSLSPMTFPHELARAMLAEQIYRAFATLRGHPYPR
jgi:23S rRNA (pseudouridine1915-N3)-methyltransferase